MAENEGLERVVRIEKNLAALSLSVDKRFDEVRDHFVEQREYIEFAYNRLEKQIVDGLAHLEQRMSEGFAAADQRMSTMDQRMSTMDQRMSASDERMANGFAALDQRITHVKQELSEGISRVERKLDRLIDSQPQPSAAPSRRVRPSKRRR